MRVCRDIGRDASLALRRRIEPRSAKLMEFQPGTVALVTSDVNIGGWAAVKACLAWPDTRFAPSYVSGFKVLGALERSNVYPRDPRFDPSVSEAILLNDADAYVEQVIERVRRTKDKKELLESCAVDESKHFAGSLVTKAQLDAKFGKGELASHSRLCDCPGLR